MLQRVKQCLVSSLGHDDRSFLVRLAQVPSVDCRATRENKKYAKAWRSTHRGWREEGVRMLQEMLRCLA